MKLTKVRVFRDEIIKKCFFDNQQHESKVIEALPNFLELDAVVIEECDCVYVENGKACMNPYCIVFPPHQE